MKYSRCRIRQKFTAAALVSLSAVAQSGPLLAEADWGSVTWDNDTFIGNDNGYTNGLYYSWYDTRDNNAPEMGFLAKAMRWSLSDSGTPTVTASIKTIGQMMSTPDDLELEDPPRPPEDFPYAGLLFYNDQWVQAHGNQAQKIGVTIGIVGEYSFAEEAQKFVHKITDSTEPKGWDTQLNDEIVFKVSRAQVWRSWISGSGNTDVLLGADVGLGTISSSAAVSAMIRYGRQLERSYPTTLLFTSRATNPVAVQHGWFVYAGLSARYLANQIFLDGNTFDNDGQESMDYDSDSIAAALGLAYSWQEWSLTLAVGDTNLEDLDNDRLNDYSRFGTFTVGWKFD